nr:MAG TPA: hypothetical protein [Bacteriophage sp.]DAH14112.1 MAG TPA: hypothetical protein [Caudoviricetes sp.]
MPLYSMYRKSLVMIVFQYLKYTNIKFRYQQI